VSLVSSSVRAQRVDHVLQIRRQRQVRQVIGHQDVLFGVLALRPSESTEIRIVFEVSARQNVFDW